MLRRYLATRLLVAVPSLLIASLIVFTLPRLIPGDVVSLMLEEKAYARDLAELRAKLGLDRPLHVQYVEWLGHIVRGDLGESLWTRRPVREELARRLPVTLELGASSVVFAVIIALPIGILSAIRQDTLSDYLARSAAILGLSVPGFWLATLVIVLPAIWWGWRPVSEYVEFAHDPAGHLVQFLLPGLGRFLFEAISQRDYPVIQGVNLVVVAAIVLVNLAVDTLYAVLDPRIRY